MARKTIEPLTPEEAKQRLRVVAEHMGIVPWVKRQPFGSMFSALVVGFLFGRVPHLWSHFSRSRVGKKMIDRLV